MSNNLNRRNNFDVYNDEDNFFNNFFGTISKENKLMKTDIKESENEYIFMIDLPGFEKKDIKLSLDQKYLTVSAMTSKEEESPKYLRKERFYGTCSRSYYVGDVEQSSIKASFNNGVLQIFVPKKDVKKEIENKYIQID